MRRNFSRSHPAFFLQDARADALEKLRHPDLAPHQSFRDGTLVCLCIECQHSGSFEKNGPLYPDDHSSSLSEFTIFLDTKDNRSGPARTNFLTEDCTNISVRLNGSYLVAQLRAEVRKTLELLLIN